MSFFPLLKFQHIRLASDFEFPLSNEILYVIDGVVDLGAVQIEVPPSGLNIAGLGFGVSGLISSEDNYEMFICPSGSHCGHLFLRDLEITVGGTNSKVFEVDNDENGSAIEFDTVNFNNCTSLGSLSKYRQFLGENIGFFNNSDGLELIGDWFGGFRLTTAIARGNGSITLIKAGAGLLFQSRFLTDINIGTETNLILTDIAPSNISGDGEFQILGSEMTGVLNPLPNMSASNVKARIRNSAGIKNTYVGAQWSISSQVATNITVIGSPVLMAGVTAYVDEQWFSNTSSNAFTYDSEQEIEIEVKGTLSFSGGNNDQIKLTVRKWDNLASGYVDLAQTGVFTLNSAGRGENIGLLAFGFMKKNDRVEIWVQNDTDTDNVTALLGGLISIEERPS